MKITVERVALPDGGAGWMTAQLVKEAWEESTLIQKAFASPEAFWTFSEALAARTPSVQYSFFDDGQPIGGIMLVTSFNPMVGPALSSAHIFLSRAYRGHATMAKVILRSALSEARMQGLKWLELPSGSKGMQHTSRYIEVK